MTAHISYPTEVQDIRGKEGFLQELFVAWLNIYHHRVFPYLLPYNAIKDTKGHLELKPWMFVTLNITTNVLLRVAPTS